MAKTTLLKAAMVSAMALATTPALGQDWSGTYYGGSLGFGSGNYLQGVEALDEVGQSVEVNGLVYGAHIGFAAQAGWLVYGADAGISTGPSGATGTLVPDANWICESGDCYVNIDYIGTLRGRVGVVTDIRTVVYGAAGLAIAGVDGGIQGSAQAGTSTASGLTYSLGVERITSPFSTVFAEIGYYDLGTLTLGVDNSDPLEDFTAEGDFLTVTAGINFKF